MTVANSMLGQKSFAIVAVSLAVVVAAIAAIVVSANRENAAKAYAEAEASREAQAESEAKAERARASATNDMARATEANAQAEKDRLTAAKLANETAEAERQTAADNRAAAEAKAAEVKAEADKARALREAAIASNQTARAELDRAAKIAAAEQAKADAEASKLAAEKLRDEAKIAEKTVLELRKTNYEELERDLLEWKLDLEERERALKPEKTIADLAWAGGGEDSIIDNKGNVTKQVKVAYDPEKDMTLSTQTRRLAKAMRKTCEDQDAEISDMRTNIVKIIEKLYVSALKEGRVIDADFYKKNILIMYPDWKFQGEKAEK